MRGYHDQELSSDPAPFGRSLARMFKVLLRPDLAKWRPRIVVAFILTVASKGLAVIAPVFMGNGVNRLIDGEAAGAGLSFATFFILFAAARLSANGLPYVRDGLFSPVTQDAQRLLAVDAFRHAQHLDLQFHLTRRSGALNRIIERGAGAMDYLFRFLAFNIGPTIVELGFAAVVLAALYGVQFSLTAVIVIVIYAGFTIMVTEWRNIQRRAMNEADTRLRGIALDTLANFETVKAFAAEDREAGRYDDATRDYNDHMVKVQQSLSLLNAGQELVMTGGLLAAVLLAGHGAVNGAMRAGDVTAVMLMLLNIYRPLNILGWAWREIKQGSVDIEKLFALMDRRSEVADTPRATAFEPKSGEVVFDHVAFSHEGRTNGLKDVSFTIPGGAFVGIVGPSGAGKSTILKLLFRFYDPASGRVLVDGQDIRDVSQQSLRASLGLVPQEVVLFNDTLRFNLAYARLESSDEEIMAAAERAQLREFIESLPAGLDTKVGERGLKLSGGEKQRVGLARAILLDPSILILDEATSSLDSTTEQEVQSALKEAARGRTTIAVAHRLSTIAGADKILVFENGEIVEQGRHLELLAKDGLYAALWRRQSHASEGAGEAVLQMAEV